jgi:L-threonylcarbamoyladenylate synthase
MHSYNHDIDSLIQQAVILLQQGGLVAFPTETVYGLGADARNVAAVAKVFAVKGRPRSHPLIVHLANLQQCEAWVARMPQAAAKLAQAFWPGPLSLILPKHPAVLPEITGGQNSIALRVPQHPVTLQLLERFGSGIVGPSANRYGQLSPTTAAHVTTALGAEIDLVLDGGPCQVGIESTIVYFEDEQPYITRLGSISAAAIASVLDGLLPSLNYQLVRAPGNVAKHYATSCPLLLIDGSALAQATALDGVLSFQARPATTAVPVLHWCHLSRDPVVYAQTMYDSLHKLETLGVARIFVEQPPADSAWAAINDRLSRAASPADN